MNDVSKGQMPRPKLFCSRCLGFEACRWNGAVLEDSFIEALRRYCDFITACPEKDIGLGVPRKPIRLVRIAGRLRLIQLETELDVTDRMAEYAQGLANRLADSQIDGVILKDRSPSCGIKDAKVYPSTGKVAMIGKSSGLFASFVIEKLQGTPIETEMRLTNTRLKEHFLIGIFTLARFRSVKEAASAKALVDFHSKHKLLLLTYHQTLLRKLGKLVSNLKERPLGDILRDYEQMLRQALARPPRTNSQINTILHAYGYFKENISSKEKDYFFSLLDRYRTGDLPISAVLSWVYGNVIRFGIDYLNDQIYFNPFPYELLGIPRKEREL